MIKNKKHLKLMSFIAAAVIAGSTMTINCNAETTEADKESTQETSVKTDENKTDNVYNESFENDLDTWESRGGDVSKDSTKHNNGQSSLKISNRDETWHGPIKDFTNTLEKGKSYHFSAYVMYDDPKGLDTQGFTMQFQNIIDGENKYAPVSAVTAKKGEWTKIEGDYTIPKKELLSKYSLSIEMTYKSKDKTEESDKVDFYLDDVNVNEIDIPEKDFQRDLKGFSDSLKDYFPVGVAITPEQLDSDDIHSEFIKHNYNAIVGGNCMKVDALQPTEGNFYWKDADKLAKYAKDNDMIFRGHNLLWHSQVPSWFFQDKDDPSKPASRELLMSRMKKHITEVVSRYKDDVDYWDVVNEVLSDKNGIRRDDENSKWASIIGDVDGDGYDDDYIALAFKYAKEANPKGKLIINDYSLESSTRKTDEMYNLVKRLLQKGVPIEGIGLQMHISMYNPSTDQIRQSIEKLASLKEFKKDGDFTVQVTEMDMSMYSGSSEQKKEPTKEILARQAAQYKRVFDVFKDEKEKGNLGLVMLWGNSDDDTWLDDFPVKGRGDAPLIFDRNLQAKPAYYAIVDPSKADIYKATEKAINSAPLDSDNSTENWTMAQSFDVDTFVKNTSGASAKVKTMWDDQNLYVLTDVKDMTVSGSDTVDIYVDKGNGNVNKYTANRNEHSEEMKINSNEDGYKVEMAIPLGEIKAEVGSKVGFDVRISDYNEDNNLNSIAVWNDYSREEPQDKNFGYIKLENAPKFFETKKGTPNVDAEIDEVWNKANSFTTDVSISGTNTAKANVRTLWDEDYLYALFEVKDSNLDKSSKNDYEQDSIEAFIDENNARTPSYDGDDAQYRVNFENNVSGNGSRITDKFKSAAKVTDDGYIVEIAIPFHNKAHENQVLGFDAQVNDAKDGKRVGVNIWSDSTGNTWSNMVNVGSLRLTDN